MESLGFLHQGKEQTEEEPGDARAADSTVRAAPPPQSAKPPPPRPPSTYACDIRVESISDAAGKGKSTGQGKGQGKPKGKSNTAVGTKGSKCPTETQEAGASSEYTSYTARGKNWGAR